MKVSIRTSTRTENTASQLTSTTGNLQSGKTNPGALLMRRLCSLLLIACISVSGVKAQLSGPKSVPVDYPTLAAAIADLNTQGVGVGGVTITVAASTPQTAPAGGYIIGGPGSAVLTTSSATQQIVIEGSSNVVTAGVNGAGNLNDGIFKLVGADWVTIQHFTMQENPANTVIAVASNTMTEWGVALLLASDADGAQNNTIQNNIISLNNTYSNSFGIYSNTRHLDGPNSADVTGLTVITNSTTAPNSNNKVYSNTVSNVNVGMVLIGSSAVANMDVNNDIGGVAPGTGNSFTGFGASGLIGTAYTGTGTANASAIIGAYIMNQLGYNFSYNTLTTSLNTGTGIRAIVGDYLNSPTTTATNNMNNNTLTMTNAGTGSFQVIVMGTITLVGLTPITQNINNNNFTNNAITGASSAVTMIGILNFGLYGTLNMNNNIYSGNTSTATTGGFNAINNQGGVVNTVNMNGNQIGTAVSPAISFSAATTGAPIALFNSSAGGTATSTINMNNNIFRGMSFVTCGQISLMSNQNNTVAAVNYLNNQVGTATNSPLTFSGAQNVACLGIFNTGCVATGLVTVSGNDFRSFTNTVAAAAAGSHIYIQCQTSNSSAIIDNNTFTNFSVNSLAGVTLIAHTLPLNLGNFTNVTNNRIVGTFNKIGATGNVICTTTAATALFGSSLTMTGNNFSNITVAGASTITGFSNTSNNTTKTITGNTFNNWTAITGAITGMTLGGVNNGNVSSISNNNITTLTGQAAITGIAMGSTTSAASVLNINSNTITGLSSTGTGGTVTGISSSNLSGIVNIASNTISTLSSTGASSTIVGITVTGANDTRVTGNNISGLTGTGITSPVANGISVTGGVLVTLNANKICNIAENGAISTTAGPVNGILLSGGGTNAVYATNNLVADLRTPAASQADAIRGIAVTSSTALTSYNIYNNTVYLSASSSGANFGSTGMFHTASATATTAKLDLRNNIIVNNSTANGTGIVSALRRGTTAATYGNYAITSNNNLYYAGTPSATQAILNDNGTVYGTAGASFAFGPVGTVGSFQNQVSSATRESASFTQVIPATAGGPTDFFQSFDCTNPATFLHITAGLTTQAESGGSPIPNLTTDFDGNTRNTSTPDVGADEFTGVSNAPVFSGVTVPANACTPAPHLITATVTTASGAITTVTLNYNNGAAGSVAMTTGGGGIYTGTIPAGASGATVTWSITAVSDVPASSIYQGTPYTDDPLVNFTVSVSANQNPVCSGSPTILTVNLGNPVPSYTPTTGASTPQVDEDFGNITITNGVTTILNNTSAAGSLTGTIGTAAGIAGGYSDFTGFGPYVLNPGVVYNFSASVVTQSTSSSFSNAVAIYIDYNKNGVFTDAGENVYNQPATISGPHTVSGSFTVPGNAATGLTRMRIIVNEGLVTSPTMAVTWGEYEDYTLNIIPMITGYSWSAGGPVLGTTNPITVNPTGPTTYTATVTASGCTKTPSLLINTLALPETPLGNNSTQCGVGSPVNDVVTRFISPNISSGAFRWYDAEFNGNLLQTGGNNYTGSISSTTTLWVSESNGTCESLRYPLVETVNQPDQITAHVDFNNPCINTPISLSVTNNNPTPVNVYTYTWSVLPVPGSGLVGSPTGTPVPVTPTAAGTYIYKVTGFDLAAGSCTAISTVSVVVKPAPIIDSVRANPTTICAGVPVNLSAYVAQLGPQTQPTGYCPVTFTDPTEDDIGQVTFAGINNPAVRPTPQSSNPAASSVYTDFTGSVTAANIFAGATYPMTVYHFHSTTDQSTNFCNVYIDFNRDGLFTGLNEVFTLTKPGGTFYEDFVGNITIPPGASLGVTRMRVYLKESAIVGPCTNGTWGEAEDYLVNIVSQDLTATYNWTWPTLQTATGANITVTPAVPTTYSVTATGTNGCTSPASTVDVTVNPLPALPTGTGSEQCGTRVPEANVSSNSGAGTPIFRWYDAAAPGGVLQQEGPSTTYLLPISLTHEFYVAELSAAGCEGPRVHITAAVNAPDAIQAFVSGGSHCINNQITLTTTHTQVNNIYNFVWTVDNIAGSGMTPPVQGDDGNGVDGGSPIPVNVTPDAAGTYTYTVTATDPVRQCINTSSVTVIINPKPTNVTAQTTSVPCIGSTIDLTSSAQTGGPLPINYSEGFETSVPPTGWSIFNNATGSTWIAANLITGASFHTGANALGMLFNSSQNSDAYAITSAQTLEAGHTYTLSFWYKTNSLGGARPENFKIWVGTAANIAAQTTLLHTYSNQINEAFVQASVNFTPVTGGNYYFSFNCFSAPNSSNLLTIDDVNIIDATPLIITNYSWVSDNSNPVFTSNLQNPTGITINQPTTYTVTVTSSFGCTQSQSVLVTPNVLPPAPIGTNSDQCGLRVPTASVATGGGGAGFKWYNQEFNGTLLQTGGSTYTTPISTTTTLWVSESNGQCESLRTPVTVNVVQPDPVTAHSDLLTVCANSPISLSATNDNPTPVNTYVYTWTATPVPGSGIPTNIVGSPVPVTPTAANTYSYLVTAYDAGGVFGGCTTTASVSVLVNPQPQPVVITPPSATICPGGNVTLTAISGGTTALISQNFDGVTAPALPVGWTANNVTGAAPLWVTSNSGTPTPVFFSTPNAAFVDDPGTPSEKILVSPAITLLTASAQLTFRNNYITESGFDGGVLEISINGGAFADIVTAGGSFVTGGYTAVISSSFGSPIGGRQAWTGTTSGAYVLVTVNLPASAAGQSIVLRWRSCSDSSVGSTGWRIDDVVITDNLPSAPITWSAQPGLNVYSGSTVIATPAGTTTWTATATNAGCTISTDVTVTVSPVTAVPTANGTNPASSCSGFAVLLDANPTGGQAPYTYVWTDDDPTTTDPISTNRTLTVNPTTTTTYTVVISACSTSTAPTSVTVNVNPLPTASIAEGPGPLTVCNPLTQLLTAVTTTGSPTYQWTLNGVNISVGGTGPTYTVSGVSTGTYRVKITESTTGCSTTSAGVVVTINPSPTGVAGTVLPNPICIGGITTLTGTAVQPPATVLSQNFDAGLGAWTTVNNTTGGAAPANVAWTVQPNPYDYPGTSPGSTGLVTFNSGGGSNFIITNSDWGGSGTSANTLLTSPAFSTMGYLTLSLSFNHYYRHLGTPGAFVEVSTDGSLWTPVANYIATVGTPTAFVAAPTIDLSAYIGNPNLQIRFRYTVAWDYYWALDDILVSGTFSPVSFSWTASPALGSGIPVGPLAGSPVNVTPTIASLTGYTYTVTATNGFNCSTSANTVPLIVNALPVLGISGYTTPICIDQPAQALVGSPTGGTFSGPGVTGTVLAGFTFTPALAGAGDHTITYTYTDVLGTGCTNSTTTSIHVNALPPAPSISLVNNVNGTSTITASSYTGTLTWSNGGSDNPHIVNAAGPYTVTQTDGNGCTSLPSNQVVAGPSITADPALGGMDITSLADVSQNANILAHGQTFKLWVPVYNFEQDFAVPNGATKITIDLGTKLVVDPSFSMATAPLSAYFSWSHAVVFGHDIITGMQIAALPGDFDNMAIFQVISSGSCNSTIEANFVVDNHASVILMNDLVPLNNQAKLQYGLPTTLSYVKTDVVCNGAADGTITVTASEGTTVTVNGNPYNPLANYGPGNYTILVSATNDVSPFTACTASTIVSITEPSLMVLNTAPSTNVTGCFGDHTGAAAVFVTGGTPFAGPSYHYSWNTVPVQTTAIATGLGAGDYTVTVTDANGCIKTATVTITEPPQLVPNISAQTNVDCHGNNTGSATVSVIGGTPFAGPTYQYSWNTVPVQTTATATGLVQGTYIVTVTDSHGCTANTSVLITEPDVLTAVASVSSQVSCNGVSDGIATVVVNGGTAFAGPVYHYLWNDASAQTTQTASHLPPGDYTVTVTDAHNCVVTSNTVSITQPNVLSIAINGHTNNSCHGGSTGSITADAAGGTISYTYTITGPTINNTGQASGVFTGLSAGNYTITVTDAHGCISISSIVNITEPLGLLPDISLGADYTTNFFASNGVSTTIVYNVAEIAGNPAVGDTIRITKVAGYLFSFNSSLTVNPINPLNTLDNPRWKIDNSNPAFVSLILDPIPQGDLVPGVLNCQQRVYVAINITRNTPNLSTFTLSARLRRANSEVNLANNLNSIVFSAE